RTANFQSEIGPQIAMKIIDHIDSLPSLDHPVVTVGTYDGVHLGHQKILREMRRKTKARNGASVVLTFEPHPQTMVAPESAPFLLTTKPERIAILEKEGIDETLFLPFDAAMARLDAEEFVRKILVDGIGVEAVVLGTNHAFGRGRSGNVRSMKRFGEQFGFEVDAVPPLIVDDAPVSSTRIRGLIREGHVAEAARLLGRPYSIAGEVIQGDGRGRRLGFPTANLRIDHPRKLLPADGVYAMWAEWGGARFPAVMNIGVRPSFGAGRAIEVHLLDFKDTIYGATVRGQLVEKIREEKQFDPPEALSEQIAQDIERTRALLHP
ncbi:MAG: bifunctional riboflavin kinase/FAD synthetase, partial [Candidatus Latescibacteria bacterium]|nr:bifunctional riboflavin kinase/FAD synthetase [Candidatus Latescibacterota bacterium]